MAKLTWRPVVGDDNELPYLSFEDPAHGRQTVPLSAAAGVATLGRRSDNDIPLSWDPNVSRVHAQLQPVGGEWVIVDDGLSSNGTQVNGQRLVGRRRLHDGDVITVGLTHLTYRSPFDQASPTATAPHRRPAPNLTESQRRVLAALCRPCLQPDVLAPPASNRSIAAELCLGVDAVKAHLRGLFAKFGIEDLPHNEKRIRLVAEAIDRQAVSR
ncbi:MAG: FHA domain-containing protein [Acidimicrobiaceae bacterium]|nr:FHA domain-containing protein [Acidimicrobiaceae bacterium]